MGVTESTLIETQTEEALGIWEMLGIHTTANFETNPPPREFRSPRLIIIPYGLCPLPVETLLKLLQKCNVTLRAQPVERRITYWARNPKDGTYAIWIDSLREPTDTGQPAMYFAQNRIATTTVIEELTVELMSIATNGGHRNTTQICLCAGCSDEVSRDIPTVDVFLNEVYVNMCPATVRRKYYGVRRVSLASR